MTALVTVLAITAVLSLIGLSMSFRVVQQYEEGVLFRLGRVIGVKQPGLALIIPLVDVLRRVSMRIVTMPIQSQGIIRRDNVSVDVSAVAYRELIVTTPELGASISGVIQLPRLVRCIRVARPTRASPIDSPYE